MVEPTATPHMNTLPHDAGEGRGGEAKPPGEGKIGVMETSGDVVHWSPGGGVTSLGSLSSHRGD